MPDGATRELLVVQSDILARAAQGVEIEELFGAICRMIEGSVAGVVCTVLLVDGPVLRVGAAPGMPSSFVAAVDGQPWGMGQGSCGTTVASGEPTLSKDIRTDPRWEPWRGLAEAFPFAACWSVPVFRGDGPVIGTFAAYAATPRLPSLAEYEMLELGANLTAVLLGQHAARAAMTQIAARLRERNAELRAVNREKAAFVSMTSHELRTPLSSILGWIETLRTRWEELGESDRQTAVEVIGRQTSRLHALVDDLLTLSSVTAALEAVGGGLDVTVDVPDTLRVVADPRHVQQVVENLLTNAQRYAAGAPMEVVASREGEVVVVRVHDGGPGVPAEAVQRVFEPFVRLSPESGARGTGLGLAIVRMLVRANGGDAWVEPSPLGGACFAFSLPCADVVETTRQTLSH